VSKLKLGVVESDKPVSVTVRFPVPIYRDLEAYAEAHSKETQQPKVDIRKLIVPMVVHFLATDRGFSSARKQRPNTTKGSDA
jgi:hypothetical protein